MEKYLLKSFLSRQMISWHEIRDKIAMNRRPYNRFLHKKKTPNTAHVLKQRIC